MALDLERALLHGSPQRIYHKKPIPTLVSPCTHVHAVRNSADGGCLFRGEEYIGITGELPVNTADLRPTRFKRHNLLLLAKSVVVIGAHAVGARDGTLPYHVSDLSFRRRPVLDTLENLIGAPVEDLRSLPYRLAEDIATRAQGPIGDHRNRLWLLPGDRIRVCPHHIVSSGILVDFADLIKHHERRMVGIDGADMIVPDTELVEPLWTEFVIDSQK